VSVQFKKTKSDRLKVYINKAYGKVLRPKKEPIFPRLYTLVQRMVHESQRPPLMVLLGPTEYVQLKFEYRILCKAEGPWVMGGMKIMGIPVECKTKPGVDFVIDPMEALERAPGVVQETGEKNGAKAGDKVPPVEGPAFPENTP